MPAVAQSQSARMSKITDDGLTQSGTGFFIAVYPYGNNGRQRINHLHHLVTPSTPPIQVANSMFYT